ncbi:MAG: TetR/AcrR family transcriptional regulator [Eggerthellaceae bacterium]|nr:TetR/AcrR family transcriptional regulator [Eggerthellaceae bacterium]
MSKFTEQAIIAAFLDELAEKPFDKITVTGIVKRCGINRNTFYYHYQDMFALVDDMLKRAAAELSMTNPRMHDWQQAFAALTSFARAHKSAFYHLYNSSNNTRIEAYFHYAAEPIVESYVRHEAAGLEVSDQVIIDLSNLLALTLQSLTIQWLIDGMSNEFDDYIARIARILDGTVRLALEKSTREGAASAGALPAPHFARTQ